MRLQPLICVEDVEASSRWYRRLVGCQSGHDGPDYDRFLSHGTLILQLFNWHVEHHHGPLGDPRFRPYGNGVLLWFDLDDLDDAVTRANELKAEIIKPRHRSEHADWECWLRDPDGYTIVLASPHGSAE